MIVTLDFVKLFQGKLMAKDEDMKSVAYGEDDPIYCKVNSSNLNEELGCVEYIFSDKTGTLTCNIMDFKNVVVNGQGYGESASSDVSLAVKEAEQARRPKVTNVDFHDDKFFGMIANKDPDVLYNIPCLFC